MVSTRGSHIHRRRYSDYDLDRLDTLDLMCSQQTNDFLTTYRRKWAYPEVKKVWLKNILFFKAEGSYCNVVTTEKTYSLSSNLNHVAKKINHPSFIRIHRSYVANINNVEGLDNTYLYLQGHHIHYSKSHRKELSELLQRIS